MDQRLCRIQAPFVGSREQPLIAPIYSNLAVKATTREDLFGLQHSYPAEENELPLLHGSAAAVPIPAVDAVQAKPACLVQHKIGLSNEIFS